MLGEKTQDELFEGEIDQVQLTSLAVSPADIPVKIGFETPEPLLIGLAGKKRSGKDSTMLMLNLELRDIEDEHAVVMPMSFAAPLKNLAKDMYGWTGKKDVIGRWLLQKLGTEKIRAEDPDYWVKSAARRLQDAMRASMFPPTIIVFTDARFQNEADFIKKRGGEMWKIVRLPQALYEGGGTKKGHSILPSNVNELNPDEISYLAALIDGEGSIEVAENNVHISITNNSLEFLEQARAYIGTGSIYAHDKRHPNTTYRLHVFRMLDVHHLLTQILPKLIVKKKRATLCISWCEDRMQNYKPRDVLEKHASETGLDNYKDWDAILRAKDLDELYEKVRGQIIRLRREGKLSGL